MSRAVILPPLLIALMPLAAQADFVEDSQMNLGLRNFYVDRDFKGDNPRTSRDGSWSQGFDLRFTSGYTQGQLAFGLDAAAQYAYRLDGGGGTNRHERRGFHGSAREGQAATAGTAISGLELELQSGHGAVVRDR